MSQHLRGHGRDRGFDIPILSSGVKDPAASCRMVAGEGRAVGVVVRYPP
jgi:hypothetical protein